MAMSKETSIPKDTRTTTLVASAVSKPKEELRQVLRMRDLVLLVIGTVIGSGMSFGRSFECAISCFWSSGR